MYFLWVRNQSLSILRKCLVLLVVFDSSIHFWFLANAAAAASGIIFFISYLLYTFVRSRYDTMSTSSKLAVSLNLNIAMSLGMTVLGRYEGAGSCLIFACLVLIMWRRILKLEKLKAGNYRLYFCLHFFCWKLVLNLAVLFFCEWYFYSRGYF